jgi:hypothetical protein
MFLHVEKPFLHVENELQHVEKPFQQVENDLQQVEIICHDVLEIQKLMDYLMFILVSSNNNRYPFLKEE